MTRVDETMKKKKVNKGKQSSKKRKRESIESSGSEQEIEVAYDDLRSKRGSQKKCKAILDSESGSDDSATVRVGFGRAEVPPSFLIPIATRSLDVSHVNDKSEGVQNVCTELLSNLVGSQSMNPVSQPTSLCKDATLGAAAPRQVVPNAYGSGVTGIPVQKHLTQTSSRRKRFSQTNSILRILLRTGIMPSVSSADIRWYTILAEYGVTYDRRSTNKPLFMQVLLELPTRSDSEAFVLLDWIKRNEAQETTKVLLRSLREVRPVLATIAREQMYLQAVRVFGSADHESVWQKLCLKDAIQTWSIPSLLLQRRANTQTEIGPSKDQVLKEYFQTGAAALKLLSILFTGILSILNNTWRLDNHDFVCRVSRCLHSGIIDTVNEMQENTGRFSWNRKCMAILLFGEVGGNSILSTDEQMLARAGLFMEQLCYVLLQLVVGGGEMGIRKKRNKHANCNGDRPTQRAEIKQTCWTRTCFWSDLDNEFLQAKQSQFETSLKNICMYRERVRKHSEKLMIEKIAKHRSAQITSKDAFNILLDELLALRPPGQDFDSVMKPDTIRRTVVRPNVMHIPIPEDELL